jgi:hypothetical protein
MSKLYDHLAALDKKLADRWKIRTRDNDKHVLSAADVDFILADLIKSARTTDITEKQGAAIVMMYNASVAASAEKSGAAFDRIAYYVKIWEKAFRLNMQPFVRDEDLLPIADFLRNGAVSRVAFKSPGTKMSYAPFDYIVVGQLILNRDVLVFMSKTGGLSALADVAGQYWHEANLFMIYNMDPRERRLNIVHEGTHIIQDWQDVSSFVHYTEADAFIAQAVAELTLYPDAPETDEVSKAALAAAKMVVAKTAIDSNQAWQRAYQDVVKEVGKVYKQYGQRVNMVKKGEGASERTKYKALLDYVTTANKVRDVVLDTVAEKLKSVLP